MAGDPQPETIPFGELLRQHRVAASLTQEALAERAGLSTRGISDLERGARTHPYRETLGMLVSALELSGAERAVFLQAAQRPGRPQAAARGRGERPRLPQPMNRLIGRERELAAIGALLGDESVRLVTLTGTGGVGKTRLALAAASEASGTFGDGVVFVDLGPLHDSSRVVDRIAATLGLEGQKATSALDAIRRYLEERRVLLLLDNFEHLLPAATAVREVLIACPGVKALVTSRAPLRLNGEREFAVQPLSLQAGAVEGAAEAVEESAAVRLFIARAREASSEFSLPPEHVATAAAICRRLDGLPLAIELAAPRVKMMSLPALLARLDNRLPALADGPRDAPARQRTLRDAIAWSYELLTPNEQAMFRRLGVFGGGWTLDVAERVTRSGFQAQTPELEPEAHTSPQPSESRPLASDTLALVASLIDKSLVLTSGEGVEPRFTMLETIREFAREQLRVDADELRAVERAHAGHYRDLAAEASAGLVGADQAAWLERLDAEDANLTAALSWTITRDDPTAGLAFASALWRYWATRGRLAEGRDWLEQALAVPGAGDADAGARADAHNGLGNLLGDMGEYGAARHHYEAALAFRRSLGDADGVAGALNNLGLIAAWLGDYDRAAALHGESLELRRTLGDVVGEARSLSNLGDVMTASGEFARAEAFHRDSLLLRESARDAAGGAYSHYNLGELARLRGQDARAERHLRESARRFEDLGDRLGIAYAWWSLGELASRQRDSRRAADLLGSALETRLEIGDRRGVLECLEGIGLMALRTGDRLAGAGLLGFARSQRAAMACPVPPSSLAEHEHELDRSRARSGADAIDGMLREPEISSLEEALTRAGDVLGRVTE